MAFGKSSLLDLFPQWMMSMLLVSYLMMYQNPFVIYFCSSWFVCFVKCVYSLAFIMPMKYMRPYNFLQQMDLFWPRL